MLSGAIPADDLDLWIEEREIVKADGGGSLLRLSFSFVSYRGYPAPGDDRRSTGTIWFPLNDDGDVRLSRYGSAIVTEYPPGTSATGFDFHSAYGRNPAEELGMPSAVVDVRGPIVSALPAFANPDAASTVPFRTETQLAYSMLRSFQENGDFRLLYETRLGEAWLRAIAATDGIIWNETGVLGNRMTLVAEGLGALGSFQATAVDPIVEGLVVCGWPVDVPDLHFTRWRRWEQRARYYPLRKLAPLPYEDSREVMSFLFSSYANPDPGCPSCPMGGDVWLAQFNYLHLRESGWLEQVPTLLLMGDSDPEFPIDLEIRASVPSEAISPYLPKAGAGRPGGPFHDRAPLPVDGLRYLRNSTSTLADSEAAESVLAWAQRLTGYRDPPRIRIEERGQGGTVTVDVVVREGDATVLGVELYLTEIADRRDFDFKWRTHLENPEPMEWRRIEGIYAGSDKPFRERWRATFPVDYTRNRAYYVLVRDRLGDLTTAHSLPIRPFWNLGDPAEGPARP